MNPTSPWPDPIRVAIAQPTMYRTGDENAGAVCLTIERAAARNARLCVFPELVVTGFQRRIADAAKPAPVAGWMRAIAAACARHSIAAAVGAPTFRDDGRIYNSQVLVDEQGAQVRVVERKGLTDPEATVFTLGDSSYAWEASPA